MDGALAEHFFGPNKDQKLTIDQFQEFHAHLNTEILQMEVYMKLTNSDMTCSRI